MDDSHADRFDAAQANVEASEPLRVEVARTRAEERARSEVANYIINNLGLRAHIEANGIREDGSHP